MTTTRDVTTTVERTGLAISALLSVVTLCVSFAVGWATLRGGTGDGLPEFTPDRNGTFFATLSVLLAHNVPAALLLFSGVATAGLSTIIATALLGIYVGATFSVAAGNVGAGEALMSIASYAPLEGVGFLVSATAGFLPTVRALTNRSSAGASSEPMWRSYLLTLPDTLRLLALSGGVLLAAAVIEAAVIAARP